MVMTAARSLNRTELAAWRALVVSHAVVTRALEADLEREHDMTLPTYEVLVHLSEAPDRRLRMTTLAERVLLSRSGLSRLVDRMESDGWVTRASCPTDARGKFAVLTDGGLRKLESAYPTHLRGVRDYVVDRLDASELSDLAAILGRIADPW